MQQQNLHALLDRLPEGSLARQLTEAFAGGESIEEIRSRLRMIVTGRIQAKKEELRRAENQMD